MKKKAFVLLKHIISVLTSLAKSKSMALKSKTNSIKTRIIIFSLLKNKKVLFGSISDKIHAILGHQDKMNNVETEEEKYHQSKAIVLYSGMEKNPEPSYTTELMEDEEEQYPDFTHTLFECDDGEDETTTESVIDLVRNSKVDGEEFRLEDEIDYVADLFINRFHRQLRLQKQHSFKRYKEMLERSV